MAAALARTADQLRADVEPLDELAHAAYDGLPDPAPVDDLLALAPAVRTRVLRLAALRAGAPAPSCSTSTSAPSTRC